MKVKNPEQKETSKKELPKGITDACSVRVSGIKLPLDGNIAQLTKKAASLLHISPKEIREVKIHKRSLDARRKPELTYVVTADVILKNTPDGILTGRHNNIMSTPNEEYHFPVGGNDLLEERPVIVGSGPAGLFSGYLLALNGFRPIILERGEDALSRTQKVTAFWREGKLDTECNVQFGEGGAGTFSDGKLTTSVKDPGNRIKFIKETFVKFGAPEEILYDQKPHIGTDILTGILVRMRTAIEEMGGEYRFRSRLTDFETDGGALSCLIINDREKLPARVCILAPGHSARDTFSMLQRNRVPMEAKAFAAGIRIEHPQKMIDFAQYGREAGGILPPASYKLTHTCADGRGVYSFCMCPGGYVVNASSEEGCLTVNGMSYSGRNSANANSALIVTVSPADYIPFLESEEDSPLAGIAFQRTLEKHAFDAASGAVPQILFGDLKKGVRSTSWGNFTSCTKGRSAFCDFRTILLGFIRDDICSGIDAFGQKIAGFNRPDAIISALEARSSSPVRILRDENLVSSVDGLYPCGEGAGYAGGIISAAMDGMRCAEAISEKYLNLFPKVYKDDLL